MSIWKTTDSRTVLPNGDVAVDFALDDDRLKGLRGRRRHILTAFNGSPNTTQTAFNALPQPLLS